MASTIRRIIPLLSISLLTLLSSCICFAPSGASKKYAKAQKYAPYDAIIVPGIPYDSTNGKWGDIMKMRVYWSYYLYQQGVAKNIIYSGSAVYTPYVESKIMALYAEKMGIPKEHIFVDTSAEHSTENVYYSYYLAQKQGFTKVALATDPFQSHLLRKFPKKMKISVAFIPMVFKTIRTLDMRDHEIDAETARAPKFVALPARESFWKRMRGTMGKNIKPVPEDIRYLPLTSKVED